MTVYTVVRGDNLSKIARSHGLPSWRSIYFHTANAAFRQLRANPNRIYPGDVLRIPEAEQTGPTTTGARTNQRSRQTPSSQTPPPQPVSAAAARADEQDLAASEQTAVGEAIVRDPATAGSPHRGRASAWASRIPNAEQLRNDGVIAVVFGKAAIYQGAFGGRLVTEWRGISPRTVVQSNYHNGTPLRPGQRVHTSEGEEALLVFLDTLGTLRLRESSLVVIQPPSRQVRRSGGRAHLQTGQLRDRLQELRGGN